MRRTFRKYADANGIPTVRVSQKTVINDKLPQNGPALCVNWDSRFPKQFIEDPRARFFHIVRDPRDVLVSGYRYHLKPKLSNEGWLYRPRSELGGRSYHHQINSLPDRVSKMLFEMCGKHAVTVRDMRAWPYGHKHVVDLRYEDLIYDTDCRQFKNAIEGLDVAGFNVEQIVASYWSNSLFGGLENASNQPQNVRRHISNGATQQWRENLPREVAKIYAEKFGDALIELGYASDMKWVEECLMDADIPTTALGSKG